MAEGFSLKDDLLNPETVGRLAGEIEGAWPKFDPSAFSQKVLSRFSELELKFCIEWIAVCLEDWLPGDFGGMSEAILAALPEKLDPTRTDDDFGHFIHGPWGVLVERHGMEMPELALDTLAEITQRFSVELVIRGFLNRHPDLTFEKLEDWVESDNYHLRRLVSEGTRPLLPWAQRVSIDPKRPLPLLDRLHADPTRYVTRSVANHLNDIAKIEPAIVVDHLSKWAKRAEQADKELAWMTRHATRTLVKKGDPDAMALLGFPVDAPIDVVAFAVTPGSVAISGACSVSVSLKAREAINLIVDYVVDFQKKGGKVSPKVHKLKQVKLKAGETTTLEKTHVFKGNATTYQLYPGPTPFHLQVNGKRLGTAVVELTEQA